MIVSFNSSKLKKNILRVLGKNESEDIFTEDLETIDSLYLDFLEKFDNEFEISELALLPNIKELSLKDFLIKDKEIEIINNLNSLEELYLEFCTFDDNTITFKNDNLKIVTINTCDNFCPQLLCDNKLEAIYIRDIDNRKMVFDIKQLGNVPNIQDLFINNYIIRNVSMLNFNAPLLEQLNIDGSIAFENEIKELNQNINVSHNEEFLLV